jgi:hypothetical protein
MTQRDNILQELNELNSQLANTQPQNVYTVPAGYFEGLTDRVLAHINAMGASSPLEEPGYLSPVLNKLSKEMPYSVPAGYFETLEKNLLRSIHESNRYQTPKEELETISPFLGSLKKQTPYTVPQEYFETLVHDKPAAKVVSFTGRKWFRYAAAAVVTGFIALAGLLYFNSRNHFDPVDQPYAWIKKSIKKVDTKDIDAFVKLAEEELPNQKDVVVTPVNAEEIKELMKDVSDKEIQDFLNETPETETESNDDGALMN